ncbi:MAG: mechanosensitive ion channel, partial [Planctomycetes bacterium]|nr:mechanosensitive ion channel [Planctomycetota bacterium]
TGFPVLEGQDGRPDTDLRDLFRGAILFVFGLVCGGLFRDLLLTGLRPGDEQKQGARYARGTLVFYALVGLGFVLGLRAWGIYLGELGWLLAPAGVAIGFGMTEILSNFVSGLILFVERPVKVGDIVTVGDIQGDVRGISIRSTVVRTRDGISIIIPNRKMVEENVINWSHGDAKTRLRASVGVAYGSDVALVKKVLLDVAKRDQRLLERPRAEVAFRAFGESELSFELLVWLATPDMTARRRILSDLNSAIDAAFARTGIQIPFPQRDLHIRTTPRDHRRQNPADEAEDNEA